MPEKTEAAPYRVGPSGGRIYDVIIDAPLTPEEASQFIRQMASGIRVEQEAFHPVIIPRL